MTHPEMKYGMMGSGLFASRCLELLALYKKPEWLVTAPSRPAGRGLQLRPTPAHDMADVLGVPCHTSENISGDNALLDHLFESKIEFVLVLDFAQLIKGKLLNRAPNGCLNIHPSLLPLYRGAAPLQRALMDGQCESGVTLFRLVEKMDAGPILKQNRMNIEQRDHYFSLLERSARVGVELLISQMREVPLAQWSYCEQSEKMVTYAPKIEPQERELFWSMTAKQFCNVVRALSPHPGAYINHRGKRLIIKGAEVIERVTESPSTFVFCEDKMPVVACSEGAVKLLEVQPEGKKTQSAEVWLRGARLQEGEKIA